MSYFIMAFLIWLSGKIFFFYYPEAKVADGMAQLVATCVCMTVIPCGIIQCCTDFDKDKDKDEEEKGIKKVTLTVTTRKEDKYHIYLRFSDGYTLRAHQPDDTEWYLVQTGDSLQKLIYPSGKCEYTPVFDEDSHE